MLYNGICMLSRENTTLRFLVVCFLFFDTRRYVKYLMAMWLFISLFFWWLSEECVDCSIYRLILLVCMILLTLAMTTNFSVYLDSDYLFQRCIKWTFFFMNVVKFLGFGFFNFLIFFEYGTREDLPSWYRAFFKETLARHNRCSKTILSFIL